MSKNTDARYTKGSIIALLIKNGLAMLPATIALSGYNIVDTYFVGQLGKSPLAAMGFTFPIVMILGCIFHGIVVGVLTPVSQLMGKSKKDNAAKIVTAGMILSMLLSLSLGIACMFASRYILQKMGASGEVLEQANSYMQIWLLGCFTSSLGGLGNGVLVASGSAKSAGLFMMLGMVINAILDPFLIFGWWIFPEMGIRGAAIATIIAQFIVFLINLQILYFRHKLILLTVLPWRLLKKAWIEIIRYAVPSGLSMVMMPIGAAVVTKITAYFGVEAVAGSAAAMRLEIVAFIIPMSFGMTLVAIIGQNYGAKLYSRIRECYNFALSFAFIYLTFMAIIFYFVSPYIAKYFSPNLDVQEIIVLALRIVPWGFAGVEIHRFSGFFYTGSGRPNFTAFLNIYRIFILLIPFSLLAYYFNSLSGVFWARAIADILSGITGAILAYLMIKKLPKDGKMVPKK